MQALLSKEDRIFVAGHRGMVGSAILRCLKKNGYFSKDNPGNILYANREQLNLLDFQSVKKWFTKSKPDVVIIAAAKVGGIIANSKYPYDFLSENLKIQQNLIESSIEIGVKRLLFLGSSCIYPKYSAQPIVEDELLNGILEKTNEPYAIAKIAGLKLCEALRDQKGFDAISLMPTNLYGPGDNYHKENSHVFAALLRKFIEAKRENLKEVVCWGTGSPLREFLHVDDLADACLFALERWDPLKKNSPKDRNGVSLKFLNIGTGKDISIRDLAAKISKEVKYAGSIKWDESKPDGTPRKLLDISKIKSIGWEPKISLSEGLRMTIQDILTNKPF